MEFKIGDEVVMIRPVATCRGLRGKTGIVTDVTYYGKTLCLKLDWEFIYDGVYTAEQFDLISQNLENE